MLRVLLASLLGVAMAPAWAEEGVVLTGVTTSRGSQYAYLGTVLPVSEQHLGQGLVQRYWLDYVGYSYEKLPSVDIDTKVAAVEAALGYQQSSQYSWWGAYMGARYMHTRLSPADPANENQGGRLRLKLLVEGETGVGAGWRINGSASHLVGDPNYWARVRAQTTLGNQWHIGPELIVQGDSNYSAYKVGAFLGNIKFGKSSSLMLIAGASKLENDAASPYASAEFYIPF